MTAALSGDWTVARQDERVSDAVTRDRTRLRNFIRRRVADPADVEDILQEVFFELLEATRLMQPIEQVTAWLFSVARNRITDRFRKRQREALSESQIEAANEAKFALDLLPSPDAGPDEIFARNVLLDELEDALDELPEEQREVFIAHELMGQSFKEISAATGVSVNTLLSRKHYAVEYLRERLRDIYDEFKEGTKS